MNIRLTEEDRALQERAREFTVDHHYEQVAAHVARLPLYNPERKTA